MDKYKKVLKDLKISMSELTISSESINCQMNDLLDFAKAEKQTF